MHKHKGAISYIHMYIAYIRYISSILLRTFLSVLGISFGVSLSSSVDRYPLALAELYTNFRSVPGTLKVSCRERDSATIDDEE